MKRYAVYEPPTKGFPWLAVTIEDDRAIDTFACPSLRAADRVLHSMEVRWTLKDHRHRRRAARDRPLSTGAPPS